MTALERIATVHYPELGYRVALMLHGYGENSAEEQVRYAAVTGWAVAAVGFDPDHGQTALDFGSAA